ncbi:MAG: hypothetical protein H7842_07145 [Gammaproteobacteria bacterium SHHR-1]|uniref:hypothetical protein n=1 Tax=Magnetovirga frankeli TaxID=947516 RepID=UPI0012934D54|nr:hypothetical protein D5125_11165 [gamma proteobacterium SS-5]
MQSHLAERGLDQEYGHFAGVHGGVVTLKSLAYFSRFGETVPKQLCRWAMRTQQTEQLEQMLAERIRRGEAVQDWYEFARPLVEPILGE